MSVIHVVDDAIGEGVQGFVVEGVIDKFGSCTKTVAGVVDIGKVEICFLVRILEFLDNAGVDRACGLRVEVTAENGGICLHLVTHLLKNNFYLKSPLGIVVPIGVAVDEQKVGAGEGVGHDSPDTASGTGVAFKLGFDIRRGGHVKMTGLLNLIPIGPEQKTKAG